MLNVIKSIIATMISLVFAVISFIRGPLLLGLVIGLAIMSFAKKAEAKSVQGTQAELVQAEKDVAKGIYVREDGVRVAKPNVEICKHYRNTYLKYSNKYGPARGAVVWVVIVTRRGC